MSKEWKSGKLKTVGYDFFRYFKCIYYSWKLKHVIKNKNKVKEEIFLSKSFSLYDVEKLDDLKDKFIELRKKEKELLEKMQ